MLSGSTDKYLLTVRVFDEKAKKVAYTKQTQAVKGKNTYNCPLCAVGGRGATTRTRRESTTSTRWTPITLRRRARAETARRRTARCCAARTTASKATARTESIALLTGILGWRCWRKGLPLVGGLWHRRMINAWARPMIARR